jgi:small subunit ribosomal protein S4
MGDIKRKRKLFSRPRKPFDRKRIDEENVLVEKYGLKNKREIWKAQSRISTLRRRAKALIGKNEEQQKTFFEKLNKMGFLVKDISDALALKTENLFERRLQTVVFKKGLANTPNQARQLIVHKHVLVNGDVVNMPSFNVDRQLENKISLKERNLKEKVTEKEQ